jgi:hypothetical protein
MLESRFASLKEVTVSPELASLKGLLARFFPEACVLAASGTCVAAALGIIQGILGVLGAALSVVYLVHRIKKVRREK